MNILDYYYNVFPQLNNAFAISDYVIANEKTLIKEFGANPGFPSMTFDKDQLYYLTAQRGFQVHLPVISSQAVLAPMDYELFLSEEQKYLFKNKDSHKHYFWKIWPIINYIKDIFLKRKMPFMLDYTASGGHILFYTALYQESSKELSNIGFIEDGLSRICNDAKGGLDHRIKDTVPVETAKIFSGITRLAEYIALLAIKEFRANIHTGKLPVTISDASLNCVNLDNSWCEGSPRFRSIRSPFSLHKKNYEKFGYKNSQPLCDVIGIVYNGSEVTGYNDFNHIIDCMWDLGKAADYAKAFTGHIPNSNNTLIDFIHEYKRSELYELHQDFDNTYDNEIGMALQYAKGVEGLSDVSRWMLTYPNPMCVQPINLINFVREFVIQHKWKPRHVANILRDLYSDPIYNWHDDYVDEYPSDEKANFWARTYAALAYIEAGWMRI